MAATRLVIDLDGGMAYSFASLQGGDSSSLSSLDPLVAGGLELSFSPLAHLSLGAAASYRYVFYLGAGIPSSRQRGPRGTIAFSTASYYLQNPQMDSLDSSRRHHSQFGPTASAPRFRQSCPSEVYSEQLPRIYQSMRRAPPWRPGARQAHEQMDRCQVRGGLKTARAREPIVMSTNLKASDRIGAKLRLRSLNPRRRAYRHSRRARRSSPSAAAEVVRVFPRRSSAVGAPRILHLDRPSEAAMTALGIDEMPRRRCEVLRGEARPSPRSREPRRVETQSTADSLRRNSVVPRIPPVASSTILPFQKIRNARKCRHALP